MGMDMIKVRIELEMMNSENGNENDEMKISMETPRISKSLKAE